MKVKKISIKILLLTFSIILIFIIGVYFYGNYMFNKIENIEINKNDIGITTEIEEKLLKYSNNYKYCLIWCGLRRVKSRQVRFNNYCNNRY